MILGPVLQRFADQAPVAVTVRAALERVLSPEVLDAWFDQGRGRQYTRELLFSSVFELMSLVVFRAFPSVHAAQQSKRAEIGIGVSVTSIYNKLNGIDATTSGELVRDTAAKLAEVVEKLKGARASWLTGHRVKILDGNCIEASEHRLQVLRGTSAGPLPGKSLVVYDPALEMVVDVFPCEDGHAQERSLIGEVLPTVEEGDLWIADRNFCTREFLSGVRNRKAHFIIRHHQNLPCVALNSERFVGRCDTGEVYEQWVKLEDLDGKEYRCRRIRVRLKRKTRDGDRELFILTSLPKSRARAKQVAQMYRRRWSIETMFQELEAHLHSEVNTLGYPKAALFAFCVALVAYNALAIFKAALRHVHGEEKIDQEVSGYYIAGELARTKEGMQIALSSEEWSALQLQRMSNEQFVRFLVSLATSVDLAKYKKHKRGPKKARKPRTEHLDKPHVSTARLLKDRKKSP